MRNAEACENHSSVSAWLEASLERKTSWAELNCVEGMLDVNLFRPAQGADLEVVRESQRKRFADPQVVDVVVSLDQQWREARYKQEQLSRQFNQLNKDIAATRKAGGETGSLQEQSKALKAAVLQAKEQEHQLGSQRDQLLCSTGNIVDASVPVAQDEGDNEVFHTCNTPRRGLSQEERSTLLGHADLVRRLGMVNLEAGSLAAGGRGYYLLSDGVLLNQALVAYGLHFLHSRGWTPVQTPYWLTGESMGRCAQLAQFDEELYRVVENADRQTGPGAESGSGSPPQHLHERSGQAVDDSQATQGSPLQDHSSATAAAPETATTKYLIATSEQALCAMHQDSWLEPADLPLRYAGYSTCFRREAGSHGKDTLGIFRVHQFDKVEQFAVTAPGPGSQQMLQDMIRNAQDFYQSLGIPYRLVRVVSGALNLSAACKVDLEGWFPSSGAYRELVSASNCTDYQARRLGVRMRLAGHKNGADKAAASGTGNSAHVHMLNATLCASQRTLCCVLENHQTTEGIKVPAVLRPYMQGRDFIPFLDPKASRVLLHTLKRVKR